MKGSITTYEPAKILKAMGYPISLKKKNVGDKELRTLLNKYRITKLVCGHIHEAGPRAIDKKEQNVRAKKWTKEAFINSGEGQEGKYTILSLGEQGNIKYEFRTVTAPQ